MMYERDPILPIRTFLEPRIKYLGTQLHRHNLNQIDIVKHQAAKNLRKARKEA